MEELIKKLRSDLGKVEDKNNYAQGVFDVLNAVLKDKDEIQKIGDLSTGFDCMIDIYDKLKNEEVI